MWSLTEISNPESLHCFSSAHYVIWKRWNRISTDNFKAYSCKHFLKWYISKMKTWNFDYSVISNFEHLMSNRSFGFIISLKWHAFLIPAPSMPHQDIMYSQRKPLLVNIKWNSLRNPRDKLATALSYKQLLFIAYLLFLLVKI